MERGKAPERVATSQMEHICWFPHSYDQPHSHPHIFTHLCLHASLGAIGFHTVDWGVLRGHLGGSSDLYLCVLQNNLL